MSTPSRRRVARTVAFAAALALVGPATLSGCSQVADAFNALQGQTSGTQSVVVATPAPQSSTGAMPFDSQFTYDGSVSLSSEVADGLEVRLDVWAVDPKRTMEWTASNEKQLGFAVNVYDHRVDEKAVLTQKRRVYLSSISVTSQTAQTGGQVSNPFQFSADPRTLVPSDTQRSDRGLLLNSYQGGLLMPTTSIRQLPNDSYGLTLEFALNVWVEGAPNSEGSFSQQTVYQYLPIAIYADQAGSTGSTTTQNGDQSGGQQSGWGQNGQQSGWDQSSSGQQGSGTGTGQSWGDGQG
ncbi:fructose 1,6-bisphosphatase [Microbacterium sp. LMI1-1-1.1]|uniref:fructose 1,6-bisphosphatase n=1 Tax=Microbacterium sp. LMI1-1-1.1 TaxID=3135223 RepID=UPI003465198E